MAKAVAFAVGLYDMDSMCEAVEESSGESFAAEDLCPLLKGQVGRDHEAMMFVGPANYFEEEFCSSLGKRYVSQFIQV